MDGLVSYLVSAMLSWVPLYAQTAESKEEALARYESIAQDVAAVAYDDQESPLFSGPNGRAQTALLMLSIASYESSYRKTVDDGTGLGDHGHDKRRQHNQWRPAGGTNSCPERDDFRRHPDRKSVV